MNNKGFTLIEIIIVIVILGIMASLALPKITESIDKGRIPAALEAMGKIQRELDMCFQMATAATDCKTPQDLGYDAEGIPEASGWTFELNTDNADAITITGTCTSCSDAASTIEFTGKGGADDGFTLSKQKATGSLAGFKFKAID